jgi:1-aminocyclopropane-1-carboxylate deaminase
MLFQLPSPVQQIFHPILEQKELQLFMKRDDLIHPLISGNKWRKLKYLLEKAKTENKTHLVSFGGAYSNHLLATAATAQYFGFKSSGIVRGEAVKNEVLDQCRLMGMELYFVDREAYRDKKSLFKAYFSQDTSAFFIDEGGASAEAIQGCEELFTELSEAYDHLFCAAGTGTTASGILNGLLKTEAKTQLQVIPVFKNGEFIRDAITRSSGNNYRLNLHLDYHFGGYGKTTNPLLQFIIDFYQHTGILLDPVYTAKMLWAIFDLAQKNYFNAGEKILTIHTGGVTGNWGKLNEFEQIDTNFTQKLKQVLTEKFS